MSANSKYLDQISLRRVFNHVGMSFYDLKCVIPFTGPFWAFTHRSAAFIVNWPRASSREGTLASPGKPLMHVANRGAGGHLQSPDRSPIGRPVA
jgi:hypothetical protein